MSECNKFQWSKFNADKSEQFVIRTDDWKELIEYRDKTLALIPSPVSFPNDEGPVAKHKTTEYGEDWCPIHKEHMREWNKNGQKWYSHKAGDIWCNGKVPKE
jgi:hypothetical protein